MKVSEIKEKYLKLLENYFSKYNVYSELQKRITKENDLMYKFYEDLLSQYDNYHLATKNFPSIEKKYQQFLSDNGKEIEFLLNFTDEFNLITLTENKINDLKYESENATKTKYDTEYDTEYYSEYDINLEMSTMKSRTVSKTISKKIPDMETRRLAKEKMEKLIKKLANNKNYELYKNKHELLDTYFRLKGLFECYKYDLNYNRVEKLARRFCTHQNKCNKYIEEINKISSELNQIVNVCKKIETQLKKKWRFTFLENNPVPNNKIETFNTTNFSEKQLIDDLTAQYVEMEKDRNNKKNNEKQCIF